MYIQRLADIATYAGDLDMGQLSALLNVNILLHDSRPLNKAVSSPVTVAINHVRGLTSLNDHFNTKQSKKEFDAGREHSALVKKFRKHVDFNHYPVLTKAEILGVVKEMTTGRFSTVRTLFSNPEDRAFIAALRSKANDPEAAMELLRTREASIGSSSSLISLGQKYLIRQEGEDQRYAQKNIHLLEALKEPKPVPASPAEQRRRQL